MRRASYQVGIISVVVAVALWLVATRFEDDARWLPEQSGSVIDTSQQGMRNDTPVRVATDLLSCRQTERQLQTRVEHARSCSTDDDCTLFDYGYPIQCMTSVSKTNISELRIEYRNYEQGCAYRVYYDCPSGEMERTPLCRNNRCEVELVTIDPLKDATLQHLGIKDP